MDESHKAQSMAVDVSGLPFRKESFISSQIKQNHADYTSLLWRQGSSHGHCAILKERQVKDKALHLKTQGLSIDTANDNPSLVMSNSVMWAIRWVIMGSIMFEMLKFEQLQLCSSPHNAIASSHSKCSHFYACVIVHGMEGWTDSTLPSLPDLYSSAVAFPFLTLTSVSANQHHEHSNGSRRSFRIVPARPDKMWITVGSGASVWWRWMHCLMMLQQILSPLYGICKKSSGSTVGPTQKVPHSAVLLRPQ